MSKVSFGELKRGIYAHSRRLYYLTQPLSHFDLFVSLHKQEATRYMYMLGSNAHHQMQQLTSAIEAAPDRKSLVQAVKKNSVFYNEVRNALFDGLGITAAHHLLAEQLQKQSLSRYPLDEQPEEVPHVDDYLLAYGCEELLDRLMPSPPSGLVGPRGCDDN